MLKSCAMGHPGTKRGGWDRERETETDQIEMGVEEGVERRREAWKGCAGKVGLKGSHR